MTPRGHIDIIYDSQCSFCRRALRAFVWVDFGHKLRLVDGNDRATVDAQFPVLREADLDQAMYAVAGSSEVFRGFFAFRRLIWNSPITWLCIPLFYAPFASRLGPKMYAWVARNRRDLGCRSGTCEIPADFERGGSAGKARRI